MSLFAQLSYVNRNFLLNRDIKDTTVGTLSQQISNQLAGLKGLQIHIRHIDSYVSKVVEGTLSINHQVCTYFMDFFFYSAVF